MNDLATIDNITLANRYTLLVQALRASEHPAVWCEYSKAIKAIEAELLNRLTTKGVAA